MNISKKLACFSTGLLLLIFSSASNAYTVDCLGGETVQDAINNIGSSDTIIIDGVCASQGRIIIRQNNLRIFGNGGTANKGINIIEGSFLLQGAQYVTISGITINSTDANAIAANEISNVRIFDTVLNASGTASVAGLSLLTSRVLLLNTTITATSSAGNASAIVASSNSVSVSFRGNSFEASAPSGAAFAVRSNSGSIAWISPTDHLQGNGTESHALSVTTGGAVQSLTEPLAGQATTAIGDILIVGATGELNSLSQTSGSFSVIDSRLGIRDASILNTPQPMALRNSSLMVTNSSIDLDIASFHSSITTLDENSNVNGTLEQLFGSKVAILGSSHLDKLICDSNEVGASFFTDVTSSITTLENCDSGKNKKSKKSKKSKK